MSTSIEYRSKVPVRSLYTMCLEDGRSSLQKLSNECDGT